MKSKSEPNYEVVPWLSSTEWEEVYKNIFGEKCEDWISAFYHLSMWKVRVRKLPVGIACTLPLVEAQIALTESFRSSDPQLRKMDEVFKNTIFNRCLSRFVSIVTKGYEERFKVGKRMLDLAEEMKLPLYLVDMRNELTHDECDYVSPETRQMALITSFKWIKTNYWDNEAQKINIKEKRLKKIEKKTDPKKISMINNSFEQTCSKENCAGVQQSKEVIKLKMKKLKIRIKERITFITTHCKGYVINKKESKCIIGLNRELQLYSTEYPEETMKILVSELFLSPQVMARINKRTDQYHSPSCKSKCHSIPFIFRLVATHLETVVTIGSINLFINALIEQGKDCPVLASSWIRMLMNVCCEESEANEMFRIATQLKSISDIRPVDWKGHAYKLFKLGTRWRISLGFEIFKKKLIDISLNKLTELKELLLIYEGNLLRLNGRAGKVTRMNVNRSCNEIATLDDVIERAKKVSPSVYDYVKELSRQVRGIEQKNDENCKEDGLGVLPHQVGDKLLYKKLVLPEVNSKSTTCSCDCHS